jgi:5-(carboxyamino)imidazole ribonucleotide synthase
MKVGIIGAGQLGRMLALAGYPLGLRFVFLDASADAPGAQVGRMIEGRFDDGQAICRLADEVDVVTFDVENVPVEAVQAMAGRCPFRPSVEALEAAQDRLREKRLFTELGVPVAPYAPVNAAGDLDAAMDAVGLPAVLKTCRLGYDGRGQRMVTRREDALPAWEHLGGVPMVMEGFVAFEREVSVIGVRAVSGATGCYPLAENVHGNGILRESRAPYEDPALQAQAENLLNRVMTHLDYAGVLTIEFFVHEGRLLANEMAPRVHNSGHWTIEGAVTSQFENHLRAILDLPLGSMQPTGHSGMVNFLGELPRLSEILAIPTAHFHDYGKSPRPQRKLGHCTVVCASREERDEALARVLALGRK